MLIRGEWYQNRLARPDEPGSELIERGFHQEVQQVRDWPFEDNYPKGCEKRNNLNDRENTHRRNMRRVQ